MNLNKKVLTIVFQKKMKSIKTLTTVSQSGISLESV